MKNNVNLMSRKELGEVPEITVDWSIERECRSIVILPTGRRHDSGYKIMEYVLEPVDFEKGSLMRLAGCSDVLHLGGIGGLGYRWADRSEGTPRLVEPVAWQIDCLPKSRCLRLFISGVETIIVGAALSSQEIWAKPKVATVARKGGV